MTSSGSSASGTSRSVSYTVNDKGHWIGEDGKRIPNLTDPIIEQHLLKRVPYKIGPPTLPQKAAIRRMLNWPKLKSFLRCRGKNKAAVKRFEAAGDLSHSSPKHLCDQCQCTQAAGEGTKGDFYGLGPETGHLGVSFCERHGKKIPMKKRIAEARMQMKALQTAGHSQTDAERWELMKKEEAAVAVRNNDVRRDLELVEEHLMNFKKGIESENLTEYAGGELCDMSDKTRHELILKYAKTICDLNLSHFKMDKASYLHEDELAIRMPLMATLVRGLFSKLKEQLANWQEGQRDPVESITEEWKEKFMEIWSNVKYGT